MIQMVLDALTLRCTLEYGRAWASCTRVSTVGTCGRPHLSYVRDGAARPVRLSRATWHIARGHARGHARGADAMLASRTPPRPASVHLVRVASCERTLGCSSFVTPASSYVCLPIPIRFEF